MEKKKPNEADAVEKEVYRLMEKIATENDALIKILRHQDPKRDLKKKANK